MKDKIMGRRKTYEPFHVGLGDKNVADIVITNHALNRWSDRVEYNDSEKQKVGYEKICSYLWRMLRQGKVESYYRQEEDVYLVDSDLVLVAEFADLEQPAVKSKRLHKMIIVTFLGKMSETIELRDLKSYYTWLRHSRRMTLLKNGRKRK